MRRIDFRPETDGFAFNNKWTMEPLEQAILPVLIIEIFERADSELQLLFEAAARGTGVAAALGGRFAGMALGSAISTGLGSLAAGASGGAAFGGFIGAAFGAILSIFGIWAATSPKSLAKELLKEILKHHPGAGFCGGITYASLDYHGSGLILPRGDVPRGEVTDHPRTVGSTDPNEIWLRNYIFNRLRDSLLQDGHRFLEIQALYNFGDIAEDVGKVMRFITATACDRIMAELDSGQPCGLGLVSTGLDPTDSHQIVCYGYERHGDDVVDFLVYDNNFQGVECVLQIRFGEDSVAVVHYDSYLIWNGTEIRAFAENPSYCAIIYLEYRSQTPQSAVVARQQMTATPSSLPLGDDVSLYCELENTGFGRAPEALVRWAEGSRSGAASDDIPVPEMPHGAMVPVALVDTPPSAGAKTYHLNYRQRTPDPSKSVVSVLQEMGLGAQISNLAYPPSIASTVIVLNAQIKAFNLSPAATRPVERVKRLITKAGENLRAVATVISYRIDLGSDDIGDRCNPLAYPGKKITVRVMEEDSILPSVPATSYTWRIHESGTSAVIHTIANNKPWVEIILPNGVGEMVSVCVFATYPGAPSHLTGTTTIFVNDEAGNKLAQQFCKTQRTIREMNEGVKIRPNRRDGTWNMGGDPGSWRMTDELARQIRIQSMQRIIEARNRGNEG